MTWPVVRFFFFSSPVVIETPESSTTSDVATLFPSVFPACVVTRAQSRKFEDVIDLSKSFMNSTLELQECKLFVTQSNSSPESEFHQTSELGPLRVGREQLAVAQKLDQSLRNCDAAADLVEKPEARVVFFWDDGIFMRQWKSSISNDEACWNTLFQIVLPSGY